MMILNGDVVEPPIIDTWMECTNFLFCKEPIGHQRGRGQLGDYSSMTLVSTAEREEMATGRCWTLQKFDGKFVHLAHSSHSHEAELPTGQTP